jgi:hypothetical protein
MISALEQSSGVNVTKKFPSLDMDENELKWYTKQDFTAYVSICQ